MKLKLTILWFFSINVVFGQATPNYSINGVFIHNQTNYSENNQIKNNNSVAAYFTYTPTLKILSPSFNQVNKVKFNGKKLKYKNSEKFYSKAERVVHNNNSDDDDEEDEECNGINFINKQWTVVGQNTIPNMNFIYNGVMPSFSLTNTMLSDTLKKSDTLFININNLQNADTIRVLFADNDQQTNRHYAVFIAPNYTNNYYIKPSVFIPLAVGSRGFIKIEVVNYNYQTIAGKQYLFRNIFSFIKPNITIIN